MSGGRGAAVGLPDVRNGKEKKRVRFCDSFVIVMT
jgi:hypothetical protein